jgi:hypothetical protein
LSDILLFSKKIKINNISINISNFKLNLIEKQTMKKTGDCGLGPIPNPHNNYQSLKNFIYKFIKIIKYEIYL